MVMKIEPTMEAKETMVSGATPLKVRGTERTAEMAAMRTAQTMTQSALFEMVSSAIKPVKT